MICVSQFLTARISRDFIEALVAQKMKAGVEMTPCGVRKEPTRAFSCSNKTLKSKFLYMCTTRYRICFNAGNMGITQQVLQRLSTGLHGTRACTAVLVAP